MGFKVLIISVALVAVMPRKISKPTFNVESTTLSTTLSTTIEIPNISSVILDIGKRMKEIQTYFCYKDICII